LDEPIGANVKHVAGTAPCFQPIHFQATCETGPEILLAGIERSRGPPD
jgi:hypothetical protein